MKIIQPTCNLEDHATKIEKAIRKMVEATLTAARTTRNTWIPNESRREMQIKIDEKRCHRLCTTI